MLPDSGEIDNALVQRLQNDAQLMAMLPNGVHFDEAPQDSEHFALVSLVEALNRSQLGDAQARRAAEQCEYIVKAVMLNASSANARQAAARIDTLLEDTPLTINGFTCLEIYRLRRIRDTEVDSVDASIRWQHRGGYYRITAAPGG
jgi:hypothetical protein